MSKTEQSTLHGAVALSHYFLAERVKLGDRVVDATCGNGHDTLFLAGLVGSAGRVWAFDVQEDALAATRTLLCEAGCLGQVEIFAAGHERLAELVQGPVRAVVFNLGYLPGGDKELITRPEQTVAALRQAADLLMSGGVITVCVYTGHPGGAEEGRAVDLWAAALASEQFNVWASRQVNRPPTAPYLLVIEKRHQ